MKDANIYSQYPKYLGRFVSMVREQVLATSPQAVANYLLRYVYHPFDAFEQEEVVALLLNNRNRITHRVLVTRGTLTSALVRPADLYRTAVRANAAAVIVAHNHPSGEVQISDDDCAITRRLSEAATILDIQLHDHLVIGRDSWTSIREHDPSLFESVNFNVTLE